MRTLLCRFSTAIVLTALLFVLAAQLYRAAMAEAPPYIITIISDQLEHPWGLAFLPDGSTLVTERPGRLRQLVRQANDWQLSAPLDGLPEIVARGQGGLLDVALHPNFDHNRLVYLSLSAPVDGRMTTQVVRGRLAEKHLEDIEVIFTALPASNNSRHFGSRLAFDRDGYLFITVGDRGEMDRAQKLDDHAGSVIRLHDDGRVPEDNPFVGRKDAQPEMYSWGNRNLQGMVIHPETDAVWTHEHGPRGGDEINIIEAGLNYGWPVITHGIDYSGAIIGEGISEKEGMEQPLYHWTPSIAPSGMAFYTGDAFEQ